MSDATDTPMIDLIGQIAGDGPSVIRSLYLWQQILGPASGAAARLAKVLDPLIGLPVGADVTPHVVTMPATPDGPNLLAGCVPGGDALFEGFAEDGLRLAGSIEPVGDGTILRRFQVLAADNAPYRRTAQERVMLRYALPPATLVARELLFAALTHRSPASPAAPVLQIRIDIEQDGATIPVPPSEVHHGPMGPHQTLHMFTYVDQALLVHIARDRPVVARLIVELIASPIAVDLLGEALVIHG